MEGSVEKRCVRGKEMNGEGMQGCRRGGMQQRRGMQTGRLAAVGGVGRERGGRDRCGRGEERQGRSRRGRSAELRL